MFAARRLLVPSLASLVLAACGSEPTGVIATPEVHLDQGQTSSISTPNVAVRGVISSPFGTGQRVVRIRTSSDAQGNVSGGYRIDLTGTGAWFEVDATCVGAQGNTAWVGGRIAATNAAAIVVGSISYFYLIDNGRTGDGQPAVDVISTARINDAAGRDVEFCTQRPLLLPAIAGLQGDIRVKAE